MKLGVFLLLTLSLSPAMAEEVKPSYSFQYSGIRYSSNSTSSKVDGGKEVTVDTTKLETTGEDSYAWITYGKSNFYLYPFTGGTAVGLSYMITDTLELGANLGITNISGDNKAEESSGSLFSPFVTYYLSVGSLTLENLFTLELIQDSSKSGEGENLIDVKSNSTDVSLLVTLVYPFSKNFAFVPSLGFGILTGTEKEGDVETDINTTSFSITPFALRTTFD